MRVHLGSDHAGFELKQARPAPPRRARARAGRPRPARLRRPGRLPAVRPAGREGDGRTSRTASGVVIGGSGNGEAIAANKVRGVRCALAWSLETAQLGRQHNDANVVSVGARMHDEAGGARARRGVPRRRRSAVTSGTAGASPCSATTSGRASCRRCPQTEARRAARPTSGQRRSALTRRRSPLARGAHDPPARPRPPPAARRPAGQRGQPAGSLRHRRRDAHRPGGRGHRAVRQAPVLRLRGRRAAARAPRAVRLVHARDRPGAGAARARCGCGWSSTTASDGAVDRPARPDGLRAVHPARPRRGAGPARARPAAHGRRPRAGLARLSRSRAVVGALLMDQSVLAGVGNVYRAEALYRAGLSPFRPGREVPREHLRRPVGRPAGAAARRRARRAHRHDRARGPRPPQRPGPPRGPLLRLPPARASRAGAAARSVRTEVMVGRNLFWCPVCQPGSARPRRDGPDETSRGSADAGRPGTPSRTPDDEAPPVRRRILDPGAAAGALSHHGEVGSERGRTAMGARSGHEPAPRLDGRRPLRARRRPNARAMSAHGRSAGPRRSRTPDVSGRRVGGSA